MKYILVAFLFLANIKSAICCTCVSLSKSTVKSEFKKSDVIFVGKVLSKENIEIKDVQFPNIKTEYIEYSFEIVTLFKGTSKRDTIKIVTGTGNDDCGFQFVVGNEYIVYSYLYRNNLMESLNISPFFFTEICTRTKSSDDKVELKELGRISKKRKK